MEKKWPGLTHTYRQTVLGNHFYMAVWNVNSNIKEIDNVINSLYFRLDRLSGMLNILFEKRNWKYFDVQKLFTFYIVYSNKLFEIVIEKRLTAEMSLFILNILNGCVCYAFASFFVNLNESTCETKNIFISLQKLFLFLR